MTTKFVLLTAREQEELIERLENVIHGLFGYEPPSTDTLLTEDQVRDIEDRVLNGAKGNNSKPQP